MSEGIYLTVAQAAKRVKRSRRTIERWISDKDDPLPVEWWSNIRMVRIENLLRVYRSKLAPSVTRYTVQTPEQIAHHLVHKYGYDETGERSDEVHDLRG